MSSSLEGIYFRSPRWFQDMMVSAYGLQLRNERYHGRHDRDLRRLETTPLDDRDAVRRIQRDLLRRTVAHAFAEVPYYRELAARTGLVANDIRDFDDLARLPIIEKEELRRDPLRFCATSLVRRRGTIVLHTSGTTGTALSVYCDNDARRHHYAFWSRLRRHHGLEATSRRATMFGRIICRPEQRQPPFWRYDAVGRNLLMSSYHLSPGNLPHYARKLAAYRPREIIGYASSLYLLARHLLEDPRVEVRPQVVFTTADHLLPHYREAIAAAFGCPVIDQYGCAEMAIFAADDKDGSYLVHPEHGLLEVVGSDGTAVGSGGTGEAVCTGFVNDVMPLIRYRLGDRITVGELDPRDAPLVPRFQAIEGRIDDVLYAPDGRPLGRLSPIWKVVDGIHETQVVQNDLDSLDVHLVVDPGFRDDPAREPALLAEIRKRSGPDMAIRLHYEESIAKNANGKFRTVISRVARP